MHWISLAGWRRGLVAGAMFLAAGGAARAQTVLTWDGGGTDNNWNTATNWNPDTAPANGYSLVFAGTTRLTSVNNQTSRSINGITFAPGAGAFTLSGNAITFSGSVVNNSTNLQTLNLPLTLSSGSHSLATTAGGGDLTFGAALGNPVSGTASVLKYGAGTATLAATNGFTGGVQTYQGTLALDFAANGLSSNLIDATNSLFLRGGTLSVRGNSGSGVTTSQTFAAAQLNSGNNTALVIDPNGGGGTGVVFGGSSFVHNAGSSLQLSLPAGATFTVPGATTAQSGILPYVIVNGTTFGGFNAGAVTAFNAYTTPTGAAPTLGSDTTATIRIDNTSSGAVGLGATTTSVNSILFSDTNARTIGTTNRTLNLGVTGTILAPSGAGALTIGATANSGAINAGGTTTNAVGDLVLINNSTNVLTINSVVSNHGSGAVSVTAAGTGTVVLAGTNTYTGLTYLNSGTVSISSNANLGAAAGSPAVFTALNINGGVLQATATFALDNGTASRGVTVGSQGGGFDVTGTNTFTVSGPITGGSNVAFPTAFTKSNTGTLTLTGTSTFTNPLAISGGVLSAAADSALGGNTSISVAAGGTLQLATANTAANNRVNNAAAITLGGTASGNATIQIAGVTEGSGTTAGVGLLTLTASSVNNVVDFASLSNGTLSLAGFVPNGATLTVGNYVNDGTDHLIFNQDLSAAGTLNNIVFSGYGAPTETALGGGFYEISPTAVPEPGTALAAALFAGMALAPAARRWVRLRRGGSAVA